MVPAIRQVYNEAFTQEKYEAFLAAIEQHYPGAIDFRLAETPVFVSKAFSAQMLSACESIIDFIKHPGFRTLTDRSIPPTEFVPNENGYPHMIAFDFGVCKTSDGTLAPRLIEMQGFPTLFGFQSFFPDLMRDFFPIPDQYSQYLNGYTRDSYIEALRELIVGDTPVESVILLEIKPREQKTRIDFFCTQTFLGIEPVCITELIQEGRRLFYFREGKKTRIARIYNRVIFDELLQRQSTLGDFVDITQDLDVEWIPHPNWFYRVSKFTLPFIQHPCIPPTYFLNELKEPPVDLDNYVLKPLFSFAGQGVLIDVTREDLEKISDPQNYILQQKVTYADAIVTPNDPAKAEIRIMYIWPRGADRPQAVINLARLSKGKMIGTRYNKNKDWVGGSVGFFEKD